MILLVHLPRVFRLALSIRISSLVLRRLLSATVLISKPILRQLWGFKQGAGCHFRQLSTPNCEIWLWHVIQPSGTFSSTIESRLWAILTRTTRYTAHNLPRGFKQRSRRYTYLLISGHRHIAMAYSLYAFSGSMRTSSFRKHY